MSELSSRRQRRRQGEVAGITASADGDRWLLMPSVGTKAAEPSSDRYRRCTHLEKLGQATSIRNAFLLKIINEFS